jgi:hypothetical protein
LASSIISRRSTCNTTVRVRGYLTNEKKEDTKKRRTDLVGSPREQAVPLIHRLLHIIHTMGHKTIECRVDRGMEWRTYLRLDLRILLGGFPLLLCLGEGARGTQEQQHRQHPHGPAEVRPALHGGGAMPTGGNQSAAQRRGKWIFKRGGHVTGG